MKLRVINVINVINLQVVGTWRGNDSFTFLRGLNTEVVTYGVKKKKKEKMCVIMTNDLDSIDRNEFSSFRAHLIISSTCLIIWCVFHPSIRPSIFAREMAFFIASILHFCFWPSLARVLLWPTTSTALFSAPLTLFLTTFTFITLVQELSKKINCELSRQISKFVCRLDSSWQRL